MDNNVFLSRFRHVGKVGGSQWRADCPACGDTKQHLYISFAPDGKILLDCKKGCSFADIAAAVDMNQKEFFPPQPQPEKWELLREHFYSSANGNILAKKTLFRKPDGSKSAVWYRLDGGRYIKGLAGLKLPLYHVEKIPPSGEIYVVEGEKDVETMERLGFAAVTSPNGAGARWKKDFAAAFRDRNVIILTDNDEAGAKYGADAAECISKAAASIKIIPAAAIYPKVQPKGDISDIAEYLGDDNAKQLLNAAVNAAVAAAVPPAKPPPINYTAAPEVPQKTPQTSAQTDGEIFEKFRRRPPETFPFNDRGNSELFGYVFGNVCRFNATAREWMIYQGGVWKVDLGGMYTSRLAKELHSELIRWTPFVGEQHQKGYIDNINRMSRLNVRENMIKDSRDTNFITEECFDRDPWLFNCKNGTYDLKNGYFRAHKADDMMSRISNVIFDEKADCPVFKKFFREITEEDLLKASFLQTILGYCLTGDTSQECFFVLYGSTTRNGKGTLMETFSYLLGGENGYAITANPDTFAAHKNRDSRQASGDIARLKGSRFCNIPEPPKGMMLDAALMKALTGRDTITARHLREREFQFTPQCKFVINTNHLPHVNDETLFTSDRVRTVTFDRHFVDNDRDPTLKKRLSAPEEISGIFNWALKGLERYKREGLFIPPCVKTATSQYRDECDRNLMFFNECLMPSPGRNCKAKDAYEVYREWCRSNGYMAENKMNFIASLRRRNVLAENATVDGISFHNVIVGYEINIDYLPGSSDEYSRLPPF